MAKKSSGAVELDPAMRIVVLYGKERFIIEEHTKRFAEMLENRFGGLEQFNFDGESAAPAAVLDELRSYGLMQRHKLVILDNAEVFLAGGKGEDEEDDEEGGAGTSTSRRPLVERYAECPVDDATLLMRAATWRAGKLDKIIAKLGGAIIECKSPDARTAAGWCIKRVEKRYDAKLEPVAADLLVARLGPELQHLDTELLKLASMAGPGKTITRNLVAEAVGLSREEKAWEIQSAIVTGDPAIMLRKLRELLDISRQDVVPISWAIIDLLRKLHGASQLLKRGVPAAGVFKQMKLWGSSGEAIISIGRRIEPAALAQLLQQAITTDMHAKSGFGDPERSLEALMVLIADSLKSADRAESATAY